MNYAYMAVSMRLYAISFSLSEYCIVSCHPLHKNAFQQQVAAVILWIVLH